MNVESHAVAFLRSLPSTNASSQDTSDNVGGGLAPKVVTKIIIGIFILVVTISGFGIFAYWKGPPRRVTLDDLASLDTYRRWAHNISGRGKTDRINRKSATASSPQALPLATNPRHSRSSSDASFTLQDDNLSKIDTIDNRMSAAEAHSRDPLSRQEEGRMCESPTEISPPPFLASPSRSKIYEK